MKDGPGPLPGYEPFDWSAVMDKTRHDARNDLPWRGKRVRTYKHYVVSPDPQDQLGLDDLRELTMAWYTSTSAISKWRWSITMTTRAVSRMRTWW